MSSEPSQPALPPKSSSWRYKDTVYFIVGALLLMGGITGITAELVAEPSESTRLFGLVLCSAVGVFPGALLVLLGWKAHKEETSLVEFSAWIKTYRRIPLNDLARNLGKTRFETEKVLATAVDRGLVVGVVDRTTDEFVVQTMLGQQIFVEVCPHCGARVNRWFLPQDRFVCPYCNQAILASDVASSSGPPG